MLVAALCLPFFGSLAAGFLPTTARATAAVLAGLLTLVGFDIVVAIYPHIAAGGVIREEFAWLPSLGLTVVIRIAGLSWIFAALILEIGVLVIFYSRYYCPPPTRCRGSMHSSSRSWAPCWVWCYRGTSYNSCSFAN